MGLEKKGESYSDERVIFFRLLLVLLVGGFILAFYFFQTSFLKDTYEGALNSNLGTKLTGRAVYSSSSGEPVICLGTTKNFTCGDIITESCILMGNIFSEGDCFKIEGNGVGISCMNSEISGNGQGIAITIEDSSRNYVERCIISEFESGIKIASSQNFSIEGSTIFDVSENGIFIEDSSNGILKDNSIRGFLEQGNGINLLDSEKVIVQSNIVQNFSKGMFVKDSSENNAILNLFALNQNGVSLENSNNNSFVENDIKLNTQETFLLSNSKKNTIKFNTIKLSESTGISLKENSNENLFQGNEIINNSKNGVSLNSSVGNSFLNNIVCTQKENVFDFFLDDSSESFGENNTCNRVLGWADSGVDEGCANICGEENQISMCIGATKNFTCGEEITQSCNLNGKLSSEETCFTIKTNDISITCLGNKIIGNGNGTGIYIEKANNFSLENCTLSNFKNGIVFNSSKNSTVIGNLITNNSEIGIFSKNSSGLKLKRNDIKENSNYAILFQDSDNNFIEENNLIKNPLGVSLYDSNENLLKKNTIKENSQYGILLNSSSENSLEENTLSEINSFGIYLFEGNENSLYKNKACNSKKGSYDIYVKDSSENTGEKNTCTNFFDWNDDSEEEGCKTECPKSSKEEEPDEEEPSLDPPRRVQKVLRVDIISSYKKGTYNLNSGDVIEFFANGEQLYSLEFASSTTTQANFKIKEINNSFNLKQNESKYFDLNSDGQEDFFLFIEEVSSESVKISMNSVKILGEKEDDSESNENSSEGEKNIRVRKIIYFSGLFILIFLDLIALSFFISILVKSKKSKKVLKGSSQ